VQHEDAVVVENCGAPAKILFVITNSDMFEHSDRDDAIVSPVDVAVIDEMIPDSLVESGFLGPSPRKCQLFFGQRHAVNVRSADFGHVARKAAPAGTDIEHALPWLDQQLRGEVSFLRQLGIIERLMLTFEIGAAILPVGVEEHGV